jgi:hypothetical protein
MFTGQVDVISNKATWASKNYVLVDDDGTETDLTDPDLNLAIVVTISALSSLTREYGTIDPTCILATASIDNGKVSVPGPGFQWQFEVSDLTALCAGTYRLGVKVTINDFVTDLIDGTIAVLEGN